MLIGHSSSSGTSIQSRISPNSERWMRSSGCVAIGSCQTAEESSGCGGRRACRRIGVFFVAVTEAAHGGDPHAADLDFLAQAVYIHFDRIIADFFAPFAQMIDQLFLGYQPADSLQQHFQ